MEGTDKKDSDSGTDLEEVRRSIGGSFSVIRVNWLRLRRSLRNCWRSTMTRPDPRMIIIIINLVTYYLHISVRRPRGFCVPLNPVCRRGFSVPKTHRCCWTKMSRNLRYGRDMNGTLIWLAISDYSNIFGFRWFGKLSSLMNWTIWSCCYDNDRHTWNEVRVGWVSFTRIRYYFDRW